MTYQHNKASSFKLDLEELHSEGGPVSEKVGDKDVALHPDTNCHYKYNHINNNQAREEDEDNKDYQGKNKGKAEAFREEEATVGLHKAFGGEAGLYQFQANTQVPPEKGADRQGDR